MDSIIRYFTSLTDIQQHQFRMLEALYREWNEKINVISRKDIDTLYEKHILHSLAIAAVCHFHAGARMVDIGTGGGFPGIPLAIFFPDAEWVLADSIGKKIKVVQAVIQDVGLKNAVAVHARAESLQACSFDFAVSRAVAPLGDLWKWSQPLLRKGRQSDELANGLICLKGGDLRAEVAASGLQPRLFSIPQLFPEPVFEDKWVVYVPGSTS